MCVLQCAFTVCLLYQSNSSHFVFQCTPQIRFSKDEACKMQLVFWRLKWRVIALHIAHTQTPLEVAELSFSTLIRIHFKMPPELCSSLRHINNPDLLACRQYCQEQHIFHCVWTFICQPEDQIVPSGRDMGRFGSLHWGTVKKEVTAHCQLQEFNISTIMIQLEGQNVKNKASQVCLSEFHQGGGSVVVAVLQLDGCLYKYVNTNLFPTL